MKNDVFISYSRNDKDIATKIVQILVENNISCWIDRSGIESGDNFVDRIIQAINESSIFILLLSSNTSIWSEREFTFARQKNKRIIPIVLDNYSLSGIWEFEIGVFNLFPIKSSSIEKDILPLIKSIKTYLEPSSECRSLKDEDSQSLPELILDSSAGNSQIDTIPDKDYKSMLTSFSEGKEITGETIDLFLKTIERSVKVFIAGSKKLVKERNAIRTRLMRIMNKSTMGFVIRVYTYEDFARYFVKGGQQSEYQRFIRNDADFVIVVIDNSVGYITLQEFNEAYNAYCENESHPKILVYKRERSKFFSFLSSSRNEIKDIEKKLKDINLYYIPYKNEEDLSNQVLEDFSMFSR